MIVNPTLARTININASDISISRCHKYLNSMGKINRKSVEMLPIEAKEYLRQCTPDRLLELARMNCQAADEVKVYLDNLFGKNNYVLIALGRSISAIAELMGHLGVDTKIIPMSDLKKYDINQIPPENIKMYKSYLEEIGLSKEILKQNPDKKYVLMDYSHYGKSLENAEKLLRKEELLGDRNNLQTMTVNSALDNIFYKNKYDIMFGYCQFKNYSYVGKLPINELECVRQQAFPDTAKEYQGNITKGLRKLFWFNVYDSLINENYKSMMPIKNYYAIYKHIQSSTAIRNRIKNLQKRGI